ncbi:hypothetical protein B566_EDAN007492, partial [Ephemera danica]
ERGVAGLAYSLLAFLVLVSRQDCKRELGGERRLLRTWRRGGGKTTMAKTPVSILQEMSAQLKIAPPQYDLIHNHPEGVASEFRFQVSFNGVVAVGAGRSKKEARHNAAEMAITKLNQQKAEKKLSVAMSVLSSHGESVASPFNNQVTRNYVGELAEVCATNQLPAPLYKEVMAEGPSHAPSFTLSCCVSQFTETAQASTKKQAKHCVAKKMLARIEECLLSETFKVSRCATYVVVTNRNKTLVYRKC